MEFKSMGTNPSKTLKRAAQRAIENDFFLAGILHEYQQTNHLNDEALAQFLECNSTDLPRLALCRRPTTHQETFLNDLEHLSQHFHLNIDRLATIIRQVDTLRVLREYHTSAKGLNNPQGLLQAARDRDDDRSDEMEDSK
jgi:hypothetical protein